MIEEKQKTQNMSALIPLLIIVMVYLFWIDWDYRTILPNWKQQQTFNHSSSTPPQVWSGQKQFNFSAEVCAIKAEQILAALNFQKIVKNGSYVYGNLNANRAAVKCIAQGSQTFMYAIVAGADVKQVEQLRNKVVQGMQ